MKKKKIEFGRKILFIQPESEKKRMEFGRKIPFKNLTKSTYFLWFSKLTTDGRTDTISFFSEKKSSKMTLFSSLKFQNY